MAEIRRMLTAMDTYLYIEYISRKTIRPVRG